MKNSSTKHNKYTVNQNLEHLDVIYGEHFVNLFFQSDLFLSKTIDLYVIWSFCYIKHVIIILFIFLLAYSGLYIVDDREC